MKATVSGGVMVFEGTAAEVAEAVRRYETPLSYGVSKDELVSGVPNAVAKILRTGGPRELKKPAKKKLDNGKSAPFDYGEGGVKRLLEFLRANGGRAFPGAVSKRFSLTPFQRRKLVAAARKAKKVKVGGNKRSTWYEVR